MSIWSVLYPTWGSVPTERGSPRGPRAAFGRGPRDAEGGQAKGCSTLPGLSSSQGPKQPTSPGALSSESQLGSVDVGDKWPPSLSGARRSGSWGQCCARSRKQGRHRCLRAPSTATGTLSRPQQQVRLVPQQPRGTAVWVPPTRTCGFSACSGHRRPRSRRL